MTLTELAQGLVKIRQISSLPIGRLYFIALMAIVPSGNANAHVKWFAPFDVTNPPRALFDALSTDFWLLNLGAVLALWLVCMIERTELGTALLRSIDHIGAGLRENTERVFRAAVATFFIALWTLGNVIITPELKTDNEAISWLQAAIAAGMFWRRTMIFSSLGICYLYAFGVANFGPFHMADYPIFLGAAAYLGLRSLGIDFFAMRAIDVARWGAAITLMWASVEKWGYPQWTFPLLKQHSQLALGFEPLFYMTTAGTVEFVLAFSLIWTPLVRRISAIILATMFISAILEFGKIDAIGHLLIIMMLLVFAADDEPKFNRPAILAPALYCVALAIVLAAYYGLHSMVFGSTVF